VCARHLIFKSTHIKGCRLFKRYRRFTATYKCVWTQTRYPTFHTALSRAQVCGKQTPR